VSLKLGVSTYPYLYECSIEEALRKLSALGFTSVEIMVSLPHLWPRGLSERDRKELRGLIGSLDIELVSMCPPGLDLNLASLDPGIRAETVLRYREIIGLVADLGGKMLVAGPGKRHPLMPISVEEAWSMSRQGIEECVHYAEERDVIVGLENAGGWGFGSTVKELRDAIEEIDSPHIGIVYDVANGADSEYPPAAIREIASDIVLIHLSDMGDKWGHSPIGMGKIDFSAISSSLSDIGYEGVSILEITYPQSPTGGIASSARRIEDLGWEK